MQFQLTLLMCRVLSLSSLLMQTIMETLLVARSWLGWRQWQVFQQGTFATSKSLYVFLNGCVYFHFNTKGVNGIYYMKKADPNPFDFPSYHCRKPLNDLCDTFPTACHTTVGVMFCFLCYICRA